MLQIITALLGGTLGVLPEVIKYFKTKQDQRHELEVMKLQIENTRLLGTQRLEEVQIQRDISESASIYQFAAPPRKSGVKFFDGLVYLLNGLVRPLVTYWLFLAYVLNKYSLLSTPWTEFDESLLAGVAAFWFSNRAMRYATGQLSTKN
ncbi:MAG: hypothetical protein QXQ53_01135 [Candidatus Methanosuratincola sp.]